MGNDPNALSVALEARLDQFGADLKQAGQMADDQIASIERSFQSLNPGINTQLLAGGLAGTLGLAGLDGFVQKIVEANKGLADTADLAQRIGLSFERIQEIRFGANVNGVSDQAVAQDLEKMATLLNDSQRGENSLTKLLDENNLKYKERNGQLISVNQLLDMAAGLIRNAGTELDKVKIAQMLGLTQQWVPALENGAEAFNKVAGGARDAGVVIDSDTIQKAAEFTRQWNESATKWGASMRAEAASILPYIDKLIQGGVSFAEGAGSAISSVIDIAKLQFGDFNNLTLESLKNLKRLAETGDTSNFGPGVAKDLQQTLDRINARIAELEAGAANNPAGPTKITVHPNATKIPTTSSSETKDAFDREEDALNKRIALNQAEADSIGKTTFEKAKAKATAELLTAAERANVEVDADLKKGIDDLSTAYARSVQAAEDAKIRFQGVADAERFFGNQAESALESLVNKTQTSAQAISNIMKSLASELLKAAITGEGAFAKILGTASRSGGTGGIFSLFGGSGGSSSAGATSAGADAFTAAKAGIDGALAGGGDVNAGGTYLVGERGPELFSPKAAGSITPNDVLRAGGSGGGDFNMPITVNAQGASPDQAEAIAAAIERRVTSKIIPLIKDSRGRGAI